MILADATPISWPNAIVLIVLLVGVFTLMGWLAYLASKRKS